MRRSNQRGFTILEVILLIVIVGALSGIIGYVVSTKKSNDKIADTAQPTSNKNEQKTDTIQTKPPAKSDKELIAEAIAADCAVADKPTLSSQLVSKMSSDPNSLKHDGNFAYFSASCDPSQPGSGFGAYLKKSGAWTLVAKSQDYPPCEAVDGFPKSVVTECFDSSAQATRAPKS